MKVRKEKPRVDARILNVCVARAPIGRVVLGVFVALAVLATPVSAKTIEELKYDGAYPGASIDGSGSVGAPAPFEGGGFGGALGNIAIDQQTGSVYVAGIRAQRIYKFNAVGMAQPFSALAPATAIAQPMGEFAPDVFVDNSSAPTQGRIYSVTASKLWAYEPSGSPAPNFPVEMPTACGGDVGPEGMIWVTDSSARKLIQVDPISGAPTGLVHSTSPTTISPCDVSIDSRGNFYVNDSYEFGLRKYSSNGVFVEIIDNELGERVPMSTVDLSNDHLYVNHGNYVIELDQNGVQLSKFGLSEGSYPGLGVAHGIAVIDSSHKVFVDSENDNHPRVDRFAHTGLPLVVPDATTVAAKPAGETATLNGIVNADGVPTTDCRFEWGRTRAYTSAPIPCAEGNVLAGSGDHTVTAIAVNLNKGAEYHFRLSARNANGFVVTGRDMSFVAQGMPIIGDERAAVVNSDGATVGATIDPEGGTTTFHVEYGTDTTYGSAVPLPDAKVVGTTDEPHAVSQEIAGLRPATEYHFRVVATNLAGTVKSSGDHTFSDVRHFSHPHGQLPERPRKAADRRRALARLSRIRVGFCGEFEWL